MCTVMYTCIRIVYVCIQKGVHVYKRVYGHSLIVFAILYTSLRNCVQVYSFVIVMEIVLTDWESSYNIY